MPGLYVQLLPSGARTFIMRTTFGGKRREVGLGGAGVTLAMARDRAREIARLVYDRKDPIAMRAEARAKTAMPFAKAIAGFAEEKKNATFPVEKARRAWRRSFELHALPVIGYVPVSEINLDHVLKVLRPIWETRTATASKLRASIEEVLAWATVRGHRTGDNPARWAGNLSVALAKPGDVHQTQNHPAVAIAEVPSWFVAVRGIETNEAQALAFLALTAVRSGAVRGALWSEFTGLDGPEPVWTVPPARMKVTRAKVAGKEPHRVPLSPEATAIVRGMARIEGQPLVFPALKGGVITDGRLAETMRAVHLDAGEAGWLDPRSGLPAVPHGLRSTFRDWAAEAGFDDLHAELALGHEVGSAVVRAYRRSDLLNARRVLMAAWADYLLGVKRSNNVVPLVAGGGAA